MAIGEVGLFIVMPLAPIANVSRVRGQAMDTALETRWPVSASDLALFDLAPDSESGESVPGH